MNENYHLDILFKNMEKSIDDFKQGIREEFRELKKDIRWVLGILFGTQTLFIGALLTLFKYL